MKGAFPNPQAARWRVGLGLYLLMMVVSSCLMCVQFGLMPLAGEHPLQTFQGMALGAALAFPAAVMYLTVPRLLDRYDPEPWYALLGCLAWGATVACGFAALINSLADSFVANAFAVKGDTFAAVFVAPVVEEFWKGLGVLGVFFFLQREFDGVIDGIIYATFTALGFAAVENVIYYAGAFVQGEQALAFTFLVRGVLGPWGHPLYTSMTGIGIGLAREARSPFVRTVAPFVGYAAAVFLHFVWNGSVTFLGALGGGGVVLFVVELFLWLAFVSAFLVLVIVLVRRRGRIIRQYLLDEVALGTIDAQELELVCSPFGAFRARMRFGGRGAEFVRAAARLGLSKWHVSRAMDRSAKTVSLDFIVPLRERIAELRRG